MTGAAVGVVAGSGLDLLPLLENPVPLQPPFPCPRFFPGPHAPDDPFGDSPFIAGACAGVWVILLRRRRHFYEGWSYDEVVQPIEFLAEHGVREVILTNSAGGLRRGMAPGHLMAARRIVTWPYGGWPGRPGAITLPAVIAGADSTGTYCWVHGPCYETAAEITALRMQGVDAVGMSTAPEAHRCQVLGLGVTAISCITNTADGHGEPLTHDEVERVARQTASRLVALIREHLARRRGGG